MELNQAAHPEDELRKALIELAQAQARADARMELLATRMDEVAAAQARADARMELLATRMDEVAAAQARAACGGVHHAMPILRSTFATTHAGPISR